MDAKRIGHPKYPPRVSENTMLRLPRFEYHEPRTLAQALKLHAAAGETAMYVSGGTDLYPNMKRRHQEPKTVISLAGIKRLRKVRMSGEGDSRHLSIGAGVTLTDLAANRRIARDYRAVRDAALSISTPLLRNMGTVGGNLCLDTRCNYYNQTLEWRKSINFCMKKDGDICWVAPSSPRCWAVNSSDLAPVMVALDAQYVLLSDKGERIVPAARFYNDDGINYLTKQPGEILVEIRLPQPGTWDATYHKLRRRGSFDFPVLGVAAWINWEGSTVQDARIALGAVASYPYENTDASQAIKGTGLDDDSIAAAAQAAFKPSKPMDNTDFGLAWRKQMTREFVIRALEDLRNQQS